MRNKTHKLVGAPGFEPGASCAQGGDRNAICLVCLALFCVTGHGFGPKLSVFGPKLDPSFWGEPVNRTLICLGVVQMILRPNSAHLRARCSLSLGTVKDNLT